MAQNKIQFQKGLSWPDFMERYAKEEQCLNAVFVQRWPRGFICPSCGSSSYCRVRKSRVCQCNQCHSQTSITSGTIFHSSNLPLTKWFLAIHLLTQNKNGISALELSRQIGVVYKTAWRLKHKLMQVMSEKEEETPLIGRVEVDDAYLGGKRKKGKRGRGSENKIPFFAAVETDAENRPKRIKLRRIKGFSKIEARRWKNKYLPDASLLVSDGLICLKALAAEDKNHEIHIPKMGTWTTDIPNLKWVNTILGNLKNALKSTYKAYREQYIQRYLSEFEYRFNRRGDLTKIFTQLLCDAIATPPLPEKLLRLAAN